MKKVWAYARVSTIRQLPFLQPQRQFLENYCRHNNKQLILHDIKSDVGSGKYPEKLPNLQFILKYIQPNALILISSASRIGRDIYKVNEIINELHNKHSEVYSILDNVSSLEPEFLKRIEFAENELKINAERQRQRNSILRSQGAHLGRPPNGFKIVKINGIPKLFKT